MTEFCSDTLKRHQKLHVPEGQKPPKRTSKSLKRNRAAPISVVNGSDRLTVDHSPGLEVAEPQFSYFSLEAWEYPSLTSPSTDNPFSYIGIDEAGGYFGGNYAPLDGDSVGSAGSDLTVNPECLWDSL